MKKLEKKDFMSVADYVQNRVLLREKVNQIKAKRVVHVGPDARFMFECYETLWAQIQEMLCVEGGGEEQIDDELEAYAPLLPQGRELTATLFFEIPNAQIRLQKLSSWGNIEASIFLSVGDEKVYASSGDNLARTNTAGKTSAVHFLKFLLTQDQIKRFTQVNVELGFDFENYPHTVKLSGVVKEELSRDFMDA